MRTLVLAVLFGLLVLFIRSWLRLLKPDKAAQKKDAVQAMVACAQCGLHVPLEESVIGKDGKRYCCREHAD